MTTEPKWRTLEWSEVVNPETDRAVMGNGRNKMLHPGELRTTAEAVALIMSAVKIIRRGTE